MRSSFLRRIFAVYGVCVMGLLVSTAVFQTSFRRQRLAIERSVAMSASVMRIQRVRDSVRDLHSMVAQTQFPPEPEMTAMIQRLEQETASEKLPDLAKIFAAARLAMVEPARRKALSAQVQLLSQSVDEELENRVIKQRRELSDLALELDREKNEPLVFSLVLSIVLVSGVSILGYWAWRRLRFFALQVAKFTAATAEGPRGGRVELFRAEARDELDEVSLALNTMSDKLVESYAEIERSNKDLENFALMVSHDLRSPLRYISAFAEDLGNPDRAVLRENIDAIQTSARRLTRLVDDLLEFSKVNRDGLTPEWFDLAAALSPICRDLNFEPAQVRLTGDSTLYGIRSLLLTAFQNLLENSRKFRPNDLQVSIALQRAGGEWRIDYHDNGPGIPEASLEQVFSLFARLEQDQAKPGLGVGLALVKRIVGWHGGQIKAVPCVEGAHFVIVLRPHQGLSKPSSGWPEPSPNSPP